MSSPSNESDIKRYALFIDEGTGKKPRRILRKDLKSSDFGKEFSHDVYLDFISDGVEKQKLTEIKVKVGDVIPVNHPPQITISNQTVNAKPDTLVRLSAKIVDPDGDPIQVIWEPVSDSSGSDPASNTFWIEFTTPSQDTDLQYKVTATDDKGSLSSGNITVIVRKEDQPPPPPPPTKLRIGHCGDTHGEHEAVEALKNKEQCNFILVSGDITDTETDDDGYVATVKNLGLEYGKDIANAQGNHESQEEDGQGAQEDMEAAFPKLKENSWLQFYHIKNVIIIIGNTQVSGYSQPDNKVFQFVKDSMVKAKQMVDAGQADWIFFMQHKPEYTMKARHDAEYNWRYNMHPIFDQYGLDISFHGHNHDQQRTLPLIFGGVANAPPIVNNKMKNGAHDFSEANHGHIVAINGSATKLTSFSEGINAWTAYANANKNGYTVLEIDGKNLVGKYIELGSGNVLHEFRITKEGGGPPPIPDAIPVIKPDTISGTNGQLITVDGSQSVNATTYLWSTSTGLYTQGPTTNPTVQLLLGTVDGTVTLTVTNSIGKTSSISKPVDVTSVPPPPPEVDAKLKELIGRVDVGQSYTIDGSQSTGNITSWSIIQDNEDPTKVALQDSPLKYSKAFIMPDTDETLHFTLVVTGANGQTDTDSQTVAKSLSPPEDEYDAFGMKMLMKVKPNRKIAMERGSDHRNGQRYNVNHKYENHIMIGYYKLGKGQDKIETKEDGPNHGSCDFTDDQICFWCELGIDLATGKGESQYEWPHADNYSIPDEKNTVLESVGPLKAGNWCGWATACYWDKTTGLRQYKAWCDPNPFPNNDPTQKPLNNWKLVIHLIHTADLITKPIPIKIPRDMSKVINYDQGFECEIRMNNGTNHDTDMKNAWVFEIDDSALSSSTTTRETSSRTLAAPTDDTTKNTPVLEEEEEQEKKKKVSQEKVSNNNNNKSIEKKHRKGREEQDTKGSKKKKKR